jgi:hypothetical protein
MPAGPAYLRAMPSHLRIITCCYCGARSTLGPEGGRRLVCHGCGAPIRKIEMLAPKPMPRRGPGTDTRRKPAIPHPAEAPGHHLPKDRPVRRKKGKRRRGGLLHRLAEGVDDLEDLFDLFD